jgi:hypothetical protein
VKETHIRKTIKELVEPSIRRSLADREMNQEMLMMIKGLQTKIAEVEEVVLEGREKGTLFDDLYNKLANANVVTSALEVSMEEQFELVNASVQTCIKAEKDNAANFVTISKEVRSFRS